MLGLRLAEGLDLEGAAAELGVPALPTERKRALEKLERAQRIVLGDDRRLRIPKPQWLFADGIISELL
jgi:oxygen-independent coproporphyrinogen-3 oxidase